MALSHTILAALLNEPATGYDLAKRFGADGHFWHASHQQIYRELGRLEAGHAIRASGVPGARGERRWELTAAGRALLHEWANEPTEAAEIKEDILIKCLLLGLLSHDELATQISARRASHAERLHRYGHLVEERFPERTGLSGPSLGAFIALSAGIVYERAWIDWADGAIRLLKASEGAEGE